MARTAGNTAFTELSTISCGCLEQFPKFGNICSLKKIVPLVSSQDCGKHGFTFSKRIEYNPLSNFLNLEIYWEKSFFGKLGCIKDCGKRVPWAIWKMRNMCSEKKAPLESLGEARTVGNRGSSCLTELRSFDSGCLQQFAKLKNICTEDCGKHWFILSYRIEHNLLLKCNLATGNAA